MHLKVNAVRRVNPKHELCTDAEIAALVDAFYTRVRADPVLGPIFQAHVRDWAVHLPKMVDFWSSTLRGTSRYRGTPMVAHRALPGLSAALFERWLELFRATTAAQPNTALRERADAIAERIAQSLWFGYQLHRRPDVAPEDLTPLDATA